MHDVHEMIEQLAKKHGLSTSAVEAIWRALVHSNGAMAQFNHPELGGAGQWMPGMTMIGDMFNEVLKLKVSALCVELAPYAAHPSSVPAAPRADWQQQAQQTGGPGSPESPRAAFAPFDPLPAQTWWPAELGHPTTTGAQNDLRYAYFASAQRLVIERQGDITIYDTLDHRIGGVSQQQSSTQTVTFTSQHGTVALTDLPVIARGRR